MRKGLRSLPLAVQAIVKDDTNCKSWPVDDMRRHPDVSLGCLQVAALPHGCKAALHMSNGNKANKRGQGPHIGDVFRIVPGTLHVGNLPRLRVSSRPPDSIYKLSIISTRCLQNNYVDRSHMKLGNKVRFSMPACGNKSGFEES